MNKKIIIVIMIVTMAFFFSSCKTGKSQKEIETPGIQINSATDQAVETKSEAPEYQSSSTTKQGGKTNCNSPTYLTKEELIAFELLYADKTEDELIKVGAVKVSEDESNGESLYKIGNIEYLYMYFSETPVFVSVKGPIDVQGPRGIAFGDTFESTLAKFPQEKDWQLIYNGEVYGDQAVDMEAQEPCAMVSDGYINPDTNEQGKELTVMVKYCLPSVSFYFDESDILTSYTITLTTD